MLILSNFVHPLKQYSFSLFTPSGILIEVRELHPLKHPFPQSVAPSGMFTETKAAQFPKQ